MSKLRKLFYKPGHFFRDYFLNKHPLVRNELKIPKNKEKIILDHDHELESMMVNDLTVDVVFTWVNSADHLWIDRFKKHKSLEAEVESIGVDPARFTSNNELYYAILSVRRHLPWVRKIYLVTDRQRPVWDYGAFDVELVDHKDIIEEEYLPTFNSHVIEANIHKINGLSEYFIYFNDDVLVAKDVLKNHFFKDNSIYSLFLSNKKYLDMLSRGIKTPTLSASLNGASLLKKTFGREPLHALVHTYVPLRRSIFYECCDKYKEELVSFLGNRFRCSSDYNFATFLVPWYGYFNGSAVAQRDVCYYFDVRSSVSTSYYKELLLLKSESSEPHSMCLNDFLESNNNYTERLSLFLKEYYDVK